LRIGGTELYTYGETFDQAAKKRHIKVDYVKSDKLNIRKLLYNRIDIFPMEIEVGYYLIQSELKPEQGSLIKHHPKPLYETPICVAFSKQIDPKRSKYLISAFNRGLLRLKENGTYEMFISNSRMGKYKKSD